MALLLLGSMLLASAQRGPVHLNWVSHGGDFALLGGGPFSNSSTVELTSESATADEHSTTPALDVSDAALKFRVPDPSKAYDVSVDGSAPLCLNLPDPWWWQGDSGNSSTPGGWLRVFGRSISNPSAAHHPNPIDFKADLDAAMETGDYDAASTLLARAKEVGDELTARAAATQLRLTPAHSGSPVIVKATNTSEHDAWFDLPNSLGLGDYSAEISNGLSTPSCGTWQKLEMFLRPDPGPCMTGAQCDDSPQPCPGHADRTFCETNKSTKQCESAPAPCPPCPPAPKQPAPDVCPEILRQPAVPVHTTVTIVKPHVWDSTIFEVDCDWDKPLEERSCGWFGKRSSTQLDAALAKARAHGGGIVHLPAGMYFIDGPIRVPDGVHLRGESQSLTSIYFREVSSGSQSVGTYITGDFNAVNTTLPLVKPAKSWAITDLSVYVSARYDGVVGVKAECERFHMHRVTIRAAAWFGLQCNVDNLDTTFIEAHGGKPSQKCASRGRYANFSNVGGLIELGGQNFHITDCDLLGSAAIFHTGGGQVGTRGCSNCKVTSTERFGVIARNKIWNANAAHWFDNAHEIVFEHNIIRPAGTAPSWGNNIDNYARGYSQHLFFSHNDFRQVWTGDREILTLDPLFGSFTGAGLIAVSNISEATDGTITITNSTPGTTLVFINTTSGKPSKSHTHPDVGDLGGAVTVLAGTGAGQYRRLVTASHTPKIDKPFDTPIDTTSVIQIGPFRGRTIFTHNRYEDGGDWQLYGNAHDWIVSNQHMKRTGGIKSWGRGFKAPNLCPNIRVQIVDCFIEENNHIANWAISGNWTNKSELANPPGAGCPKFQIGNGSGVEHKTYPPIIDHYGIGVQGSDQDSTTGPGSAYQGAINNMIVVARNKVHGGGILVSGHTHNVLADSNVITSSAVGVDLWPADIASGHTKHALVVNKTVHTWHTLANDGPEE